MVQLYDYLSNAKNKHATPSVLAYHRIDGPGSSLDLREFQQTFWKLPNMTLQGDPSWKWSVDLPRTVGITIDTGTKIEAFPYDPEMICVKSIEYNKEVSGQPGEIIPIKDNWLLKILEIFNLQGVKLVLTNLKEGTHSSGLGGSSTATIGVCILANELAGRPFNDVQLVSLASRIEQDMGVSITGTQEQSNVMFGGVTDYVWFPWGIPGQQSVGYGESLRFELMKEKNYPHLQDRIAIFHSGHPRDSSNVNTVWEEALKTHKGYGLHSKKLAVAYKFREGLRLENWGHVQESIEEYRRIRADLCADYMKGSMDIWHEAEDHNSVVFPLGAGGGGAVFIFSKDKNSMANLKDDICGSFTEIPSKIRSKGHELLNL
jgi:D-glycero-alpha-D-manno-heptose-7-phosphate kinase